MFMVTLCLIAKIWKQTNQAVPQAANEWIRSIHTTKATQQIEKYPTKQRKDMRGLRAMAKVAERTV